MTSSGTLVNLEISLMANDTIECKPGGSLFVPNSSFIDYLIERESTGIEPVRLFRPSYFQDLCYISQFIVLFRTKRKMGESNSQGLLRLVNFQD